MSEEFKDIFSDVKREALSEGERVSMRNNLLAHMAEHPARAPLHVRALDALADISDAFGAQTSTGMRFVPATLAMVLVVGLGTAYAAEDAVPGDVLYGMKVGVNESVKGAFAVSEAAKAEWETERIERRLVEAEMLVASGKLTPVAQATLEDKIRASVQAFDANIEILASVSGEEAVAAAQSDLEASLIGHAEVLVALSATDDAAESAAPIQPIIRSVLAKAEAAQAARASNEATIVAKRDGKKVREAALEKKKRAVQAVNIVRAKASSALIAASTTAEVAEVSADAAEEAIQTAEEHLKEGDYGTAFTTFQEAIRTVKTVEVHIDASERLNADVKIFTRGAPDDAGTATLMMTAQPASGGGTAD